MNDVTLVGFGGIVKNLVRMEGKIWGEVEIDGVVWVVKFDGGGRWLKVGEKDRLEGMVEGLEREELSERERGVAVLPWDQCHRGRVM